MSPARGTVQRGRLAAALAEFPNGVLVREETARLRRVRERLTLLDDAQLAAVERVVEAILDNPGHGS